MTICFECRFFHNKEPNSPRKNVWYNHQCIASPLSKSINPVTGYYTDVSFKYCRNVNTDGQCSKFKESK